ncbi:MAG: holo-ACP synthase [Chloroflexota bacterium]|jgi:holo-[acyl-carrier protein] synthase
MRSASRRTNGDDSPLPRLETGIDIVEIDRIEHIIDRHGQVFLDRVFTEGELRQCRGKAQSLAARFAAKEAAFKVLGAQVGWRQVEVMREPSGKPRLVLHERAREKAMQLGLRSWALSLSHCEKYAVAVVVATG